MAWPPVTVPPGNTVAAGDGVTDPSMATDPEGSISVISIDGEGQPWIDFDDQPPLTIAAVGENAFIIPGFVHTFEFEDLDGDGVFVRLVSLGFGRELVFERQ